MGLIGNIVGIIYGGSKKIKGLPACVRDIAIAWYKNLSETTVVSLPPEIQPTDPKALDNTDWSDTQNVTLSGSRVTSNTGIGDGAVTIYKIEGDGYAEIDISDTTSYNGVVVGLYTTNEITSFFNYNFGILINGGNYWTLLNGAILDSGISATNGDLMKIERSGSTVTWSYDNGGGYSEIRSEPGQITDTIYLSLFFGGGAGTYIENITVSGVKYIIPQYSSASEVAVDSIGSDNRVIYYGQYITSASGQIDLLKTTGIYDYTDPSTGNRVEDNVIPGDGLITVPANGICDIGINRDGTWNGDNHSIYENFYPCCERAGDVLHDVLQDSIHISGSALVWDESLHGTDFLNQKGYVLKADFDNIGYTWETSVDGVDITLNNDCIQPLALWEYTPVIDINGDLIYVDGELLRVRKNL